MKRRVVRYYNSHLVIDLRDYLVSRRLFLSGSFNRPVEDFLFKNIKNGMTVVDAGANIGAYSIIMSKLVSENGKVIAFEPDKRNINLFKKSVKLNSCQNIKIHEALLSDKSGNKEIFLDNNYFGNSTIIRDAIPTKLFEKNIVPSISLDDVIIKENIKIDFMKVNIEGSELKFIEGAKATIEKYKPKILMEYFHDRLTKLNDFNHDNFLNYFRDIGYDIKPLGHTLDEYSNQTLKELSQFKEKSKLGTLHLIIT